MKHNTDGTGIDRKLHSPIEDRLVPLEPLDLSKVRSIDDLVRAMAKTAFTGRQLGEAADVLVQAEPCHRRALGEACQRPARDFKVSLRKRRSGFRARVH